VVPNFAVIEELRRMGSAGESPADGPAKKSDVALKFLYVGSKRGVEKQMAEKFGLEYEGVSCGKLRRYLSWENLRDLGRLPVGVWQAWNVLGKWKPDVVFSTGGYVSAPVVFAAWLRRIPSIVLELDAKPGLANKLVSRYVKKICLSYPRKKYRKKMIYTGPAVRPSALVGDAEAGRKFLGFDKYRPVLLVFGGSLGAAQINNLVESSLDELLKKFQVVHLRGRGKLNLGLKKRGYQQYEYLDEQYADVLALSEVVVSRAGANSLAELAALGKKSVVLPLGSASRGEQTANARVFVEHYGGAVLEGKVSADEFLESIMMVSKGDSAGGRFENGVGKLADLILKLGRS
jgi:UDP-N-acetylglucosamine--N-acetylmuramyl-(pentapeptide) pyrophosphoryl-undecaprenol N-acetylglucosamine transferase